MIQQIISIQAIFFVVLSIQNSKMKFKKKQKFHAQFFKLNIFLKILLQATICCKFLQSKPVYVSKMKMKIFQKMVQLSLKISTLHANLRLEVNHPNFLLIVSEVCERILLLNHSFQLFLQYFVVVDKINFFVGFKIRKNYNKY